MGSGCDSPKFRGVCFCWLEMVLNVPFNRNWHHAQNTSRCGPQTQIGMLAGNNGKIWHFFVPMKPDGNNVQFEETDNPKCWMRQGPDSMGGLLTLTNGCNNTIIWICVTRGYVYLLKLLGRTHFPAYFEFVYQPRHRRIMQTRERMCQSQGKCLFRSKQVASTNFVWFIFKSGNRHALRHGPVLCCLWGLSMLKKTVPLGNDEEARDGSCWWIGLFSQPSHFSAFATDVKIS